MRCRTVVIGLSCFAGLLGIVAPVAADPPVVYRDKANLLLVKDAAGRESPVTTAEQWKTRRGHIVTAMEEVMGKLPDRSKLTPLNPKITETIDRGGIVQHRVLLTVEAGDQLPAYLLIPKNRQGRIPAVLCLHPTSRDLGKGIVVGKGPKEDRHYAVHLAERGFVCLAPDYVNMGEYKFDCYKHGYISATMKGIFNHMRCVDYLGSLPEVDAGRIGVVGHSLGGHNSIFLGVFDERVKAIGSSCGFCSFPTYMKGNLAGWSHDGYMPLIRTRFETKPEKMPWDFPEAIAALAPRAFTACAPVKDNNFDVQGVKDCITAARPVYKLLGAEESLSAVYPDAGHDFPPDGREAVYKMFDQVFRIKR